MNIVGTTYFIFKCVRMYFSREIQVGHGECEHGRWQFLRGNSLLCVGIDAFISINTHML